MTVRTAPREPTMRALRSLADTVSLALDRLDLAEVHVEQRSERRLRSMVQHASDVICLLDADLTICYVTPAVEHVLSVPPPELLGHRWLDLVHPDDHASAQDIVLRAANGRPARAEIRLLAADGREPIVDTTVTEVGDDSHAGFVLTCHDVTDRRGLEQALAHQAFHDPLTGLANRALFRDRVDHVLSRVRRSRRSCAVLFLDLDDFKTINDSLGHAAGDEMLQEVTDAPHRDRARRRHDGPARRRRVRGAARGLRCRGGDVGRRAADRVR
jgi:PAS domain S-box-containing protein